MSDSSIFNQVVAVLPARFGAVRFPGKPLAKETGKYLIQHVYEQTIQATSINRVIVATDDDRIAAAVAEFGGESMMTSPDHASGTDRLAEVLTKLGGVDALGPNGVILNVQGDEPEVDPEALNQLVACIRNDKSCRMATIACPFPADFDPNSPNCVKVVLNREKRALYFSRSLIPYVRDAADRESALRPLLHLGVYAFRPEFLMEFSRLKPTPLERSEKLEQLRVLENGVAIAVEIVERPSVGIDTPEDYALFVRRWRSK
ncbi:MAG: 3-deoxy-manno-octulosonate cytidylyltransferase [Phycisphaerae bacterium]